jgi:hypothetical protein
MATTTNFGWATPDDTAFVKDGAAAIRTLGSSIDTSLVDLKGGTTGQVLAKTSGTDMDFVWVTTDDANAIQNAIVDAKGDLISATANDTPARLAVGANGETLVADSSTSTGLRWTGDYAAGKNKFINGDFNVNQRSFTTTTTSGVLTFDRWLTSAVDGTSTFTAETFTPGTAPVAGYEGKNYLQMVSTGQTLASAQTSIGQRIEGVRTFAGQTVTISFWAKANTGTPKVAVEVGQNFGAGGSPSAFNPIYFGQVTLSTSWARYSVTATVTSLSGKTIGTDSSDSLNIKLYTSAGSDLNARTGSIGIQSFTCQMWGIQAEAGSVATAFQTATGTIQGELAACQRYYFRINAIDTYSIFCPAFASNTTQAYGYIAPSVRMRAMNSITSSNIALIDAPGAITAVTLSVQNNYVSNTNYAVLATAASGLTANRPYFIHANNNSAAFVAIDGEL